MTPVKEALREALEGLTFAPASVRVVANVRATVHNGGPLARELLVRQLTAPVEWDLSIQALLDLGVSTFIEVGPGQVLTGLLGRRAPSVAAGAVFNVSSLFEAISRMGGNLEPPRRGKSL
jgi:[acyl-carrier-protein] S-malonyltransferase